LPVSNRSFTLLLTVTLYAVSTRGPDDETGIWGTGQANGLVVVLRALLAWQLDGER
jgi:hypothetical protein